MDALHNQITNSNHLRQFVENMDQVVWLRAIQTGDILYVSPAFTTVWGRSCEDLYADPRILFESVHPEDKVQVLVAGPYAGGKTFSQSYRIVRPDSGVRWIHARTSQLFDDSSQLDCLACVAQDITEQKQIELALRNTLSRTREQVTLGRRMSLARRPEAVLKAVMAAREMRAAQRAALLLFDNPKVGLARGVDVMSTWLSKSSLVQWPGESGLYEEPALLDLAQSNRISVINDIQSDRRLTPLVRDFLLSCQIRTILIAPLLASEKSIGCLLVYYAQDQQFDSIEMSYVKVLVDRAAISLYNLQLLTIEEDSRHQAERANEIKTEFLAMISHELRTPLTSIIGFTTTLLADDVAWAPEEQRDFIQTIQREADRLQELIDRLLDLSRLEAEMLPISLEPFALDEIIQDALAQLNTLTSGHRLFLHLPARLPNVFADKNRIVQVLVNLVRNGSTYAPKGTEINISANSKGKFVQINVSDEGPGIPFAEHKMVFEAFRRGANRENSTVQGAGLGLAICKGLVEAHGGRIWIKKKASPGTTVSFTIPFAPTAYEEKE